MAYVVSDEACKIDPYWRMLTCEGIGQGKVSIGTWTGFPLMHMFAFAVYIEFLGSYLNYYITVSCLSLSDMNVQNLRTFKKCQHHHHKHQGLDPLIRSISRVITAVANISSVFQLLSYLVVCSGMISKGFGFVAFFGSVKASSVHIHLSCLVCM